MERKTENFVQSPGLFYNSSLVRKMSLPPDKSFKQLQVYTPDNHSHENNHNEIIVSQKPYSNLFPDELNQKRDGTPKRESPKFHNKSLNGQTVWAVIKSITDTPSSQMRLNESSSNSSASPENIPFQKADFTPQLHRQSNIQQKQTPPSVSLRRKQSYEIPQQQPIQKVYSKPTLNEINNRQNCSFESTDSIKPTNALTVFAVGQPKSLTRVKYSNENLSVRLPKHDAFEQKKQQQPIFTEKPNFSGLRKFFKDPFENIMGKLNNMGSHNSVNKFGGSLVNQENIINDEKILISAKNSTSNETISNELGNDICVEAAITPIINDSNEKLDKRRNYRTLKSDKKRV